MDPSDLTPKQAIHNARNLWLSATKESDLVTVENLYRYALRTNKHEKKRRKIDGEAKQTVAAPLDVDEDNDDSDGDCKHITEREDTKQSSKRKLDHTVSCLKPSECKKACEKLALLLCQTGRTKKAKALLSRLGYVCRLSGVVLDYIPTTSDPKIIKNVSSANDAPCCILDNFISKGQIQHLHSIFGPQSASYWLSHKYAVEPPSPYFSYIIPLDNALKFGFVGDLISKIYQNETLRLKFPNLENVTKVEMWAHNRPHASGHQMHFDSDDEGRGGVRNPVISTILYITAGCGGPSLLTSQKLGDEYLAKKGWLCYPKCERLVAFDGRYLHGVIPGKGVMDGRRVTLMFAFWTDIRTRMDDGPGSARPFPLKDDSCEWAKELVSKKLSMSNDEQSHDSCEQTVEVEPVFIDRVYETLSGNRWSKSKGLPDYDSVFQGF